MTDVRIAHPPVAPLLPAGVCPAGPGSEGPVPLLRSANGETVIVLMERNHIVCSKRGAPGCVERSWYEEREGDVVMGWWCIDHAIERIEQVNAEEAASVAAAYAWAGGPMRRAS